MERGEGQKRGRLRWLVTEARDALAVGEVKVIDDIARTRYKIPEAKIPDKRKAVIDWERDRTFNLFGEFLEGFANRKRRRQKKD